VVARFSRLFTSFAVAAALTGLPSVSRADQAPPQVLAMIHNPANVPLGIVERARDEVVRLFRLIGVEIVWVSHVPPPGTRVRIVSVVTWEPREDRVPASALGYTLTGPGTRGTLAYVFWPRVGRASEKFTARLDYVLAVAIAHEIGHMLLPDDSHAKHGLMEPNWDSGHLRLASAGLLHFSQETAALIRQGLER
jgi:hypothetical protein